MSFRKHKIRVCVSNLNPRADQTYSQKFGEIVCFNNRENDSFPVGVKLDGDPITRYFHQKELTREDNLPLNDSLETLGLPSIKLADLLLG
ncbi:MAG: hypothetical protein DHS20C02_15630 [Micavibrio sp.]|nr:MAG: hypothetical protein DHS20C02_15630 [Micavibrio sp.]